MSDPRNEAATTFEAIATELEKAAFHARQTAGHFRSRNIPHASAHMAATKGHISTADDLLTRRFQIAAKLALNPIDNPGGEA